jgi:hypothetical protein
MHYHCPLHPNYTGDRKPDGGCTRCLLNWVTANAERYAKAEYAIARSDTPAAAE